MNAPSQEPTKARTEVTLFRASDGDCILVRCIEGDASFNLLVDAGRASTVKRLKKFMLALPEEHRKIDLFVVTHIDADHIAGAIALAKDDVLASMVRSVWFNGAAHLSEEGDIPLSPDQGDLFTEWIEQRDWPWNQAKSGKAIVRRSGAEPIPICEKPVVELQVLGPLPSGLAALAEIWPVPELRELTEEEEEEVGAKEMGVGEGPPDVDALADAEYLPDVAEPNGSSIAFLLRHGGRCIMLNSDSHAETLVDAVDELFAGSLKVDLATLPHHGSRRNTSPELAERLAASVWAVSTEGHKRHLFPNGESIARILTAKMEHTRFVFNSSHPEASLWNDAGTMDSYDYSANYRPDDQDWITIEVDD